MKVLNQLYRWTMTLALLQVRQRSDVFKIGALAGACILALSFGLTKDQKETYLSLLCIIAPWLSCTYCISVTANILPFFAFERFAGLRPGTFLIALLLSFCLTWCILALLFTVGASVSLSSKAIVRCVITNGSVLNWYKSRIQSDFSSTSKTALIRFPAEEFRRTGWLASYPAADYPTLRGEGQADKGSSRLQIYHGFTLACVLGGAIGILLAVKLTRHVALLASVVLFLCFLIFTRTTAPPSEWSFFGPLPYSWCAINVPIVGIEDRFGEGAFLRWCVSFLSPPRYIFNSALYHEIKPTMWDPYILLGMLCVVVLRAWLILRRAEFSWANLKR